MEHYSHPRIATALYRIYQRKLRKLLKDTPVNPSSADYLRVISNEPGVTLVEMTAILGVSAPAVAQALSTLERDGLIARVPDSSDGRVKRVYLTESGHAVKGDVNHAFETIINDFHNRLTPNENAELERLLTKLFDSLTQDSKDEARA